MANREPTADELNGVKQDTVQWPAKSYRNTLVDSEGGEITDDNPLPVKSTAHISTDLEGLGPITVGTTAVELVFSGTTESITIISAIENTGKIYVGKSDVLSDGSNSSYIIYPGVPFSINYEDTNNPIYIVSDIADQIVIVGATK